MLLAIFFTGCNNNSKELEKHKKFEFTLTNLEQEIMISSDFNPEFEFNFEKSFR